LGGVTDFETIGGEPALRAIIDDFVDACFDDVMIGFLFQRASRERIKRFEYEHAAEQLGAGIDYGGRPLDQAHARHRIFGGQFDRRLAILRQTLERHAVPEAIRDRWLAHHESLRALITADRPGECVAED
jgi:hemoglobin